jgi:putative DNA primase/helicase
LEAPAVAEPAPPKTSQAPNTLEKHRERTTRDVPEAIKQRFVQVGRKYYFADGAHAFTDRGKRLTTPSENTEVIRSLVQIAQARGWSEIAVSGTERFRKESWFAAREAGLDVKGYQPTPIDQQRLVRQLARREGGTLPQRPGSPVRAIDDAAALPPGSEGRVITGRLVDYGRATYKQDPHEAMSYFVKLETGKGERVFWGVDLERALKQSLTQVQLGDAVGLQPRGQDAVKVTAPQRDASGKVVGEQSLATHRNRWVLEKTEFFEARESAAETLRDPKIKPREAIKQHPELTGTYVYLRSAEAFAKEKIRDPADQKRFVEGVRQALAHSVAQGDPLAPVRIKEAQTRKAADRSKTSKTPRKELIRE